MNLFLFLFLLAQIEMNQLQKRTSTTTSREQPKPRSGRVYHSPTKSPTPIGVSSPYAIEGC